MGRVIADAATASALAGTETVAVDTLTAYPGNARRGDVALIAASLAELGQYRPIVVQRSTGHVLAGNHTLAAAASLGWETVAVQWVDVDDATARRIVLADNRTSDSATYDDQALLDLLSELDATEWAGTGFDPGDLAALEAALAGAIESPALTDADDVPGAPVTPRTVVGDVWVLGAHRLLCGDATDHASYDVALDGVLADAVWTDPPYGVNVTGGNSLVSRFTRKTEGALTIQNDDVTGAALATFLRSALTPAADHTRAGGAWWVTAPPGPNLIEFGAVLAELGIWHQTLVWVKHHFVPGRGDHHYRHEMLFYGWRPGAARQHPLLDRTQDSVWEVDRPMRSAQHPTMKPVALITRALENSTGPGEVVLDPFAGSGSTLIAAHTTGRIASLIELDPAYCDVIARRWQEHTGVVPVLERTGEQVDFITEGH